MPLRETDLLTRVQCLWAIPFVFCLIESVHITFPVLWSQVFSSPFLSLHFSILQLGAFVMVCISILVVSTSWLLLIIYLYYEVCVKHANSKSQGCMKMYPQKCSLLIHYHIPIPPPPTPPTYFLKIINLIYPSWISFAQINKYKSVFLILRTLKS